MIDGNVYQIRNQEQVQVKEQMKLNNGTVVNPDGTYQVKNQKQMRLKDGECINMSGEMYKNMYQQRKMMMQKNMKGNQNMMQQKTQTKKAPAKQK
jgi:hypothetical protein